MPKVLIDQNLIQACTALFDAKAGDLNYVPWIDVNKDGVINMRDYSWMIANKGHYIDVPADQMPIYQNSWISHWKAAPYWINEGMETVPSDAEIQTAFTSVLQQGIGSMVQKAVDNGQRITVTSYTVTAKNNFIKRELMNPEGIPYWRSQYQVEVDCTIYYEATLPAISNSLTLLIAICIVAAILTIAAATASGIYKFLSQLNAPSEEVNTTKFKFENKSPYPVTVTLPDGTVQVIPAGSTIDWEQEEKKTTPNDLGSLIGLAFVGVVGLVALFMFMPTIKGLAGGGKKRK